MGKRTEEPGLSGPETRWRIADQRAIVDRRALAGLIADLTQHRGAAKARPQVVELLRRSLADGRAEIARRMTARPSAGRDCASEQAFLVDQLVRVIHDHVITDVYPSGNRSTGERLSIMAVGGYGRGEMAPHSDVDIAFLTPGKQTAWCEQVIEAMLYFLWDLGLKVGQSSRSLDEMVRMARSDLTIRTALLEGRYVWGDQALFDAAQARFFTEVVAGTERDFVTEKLAERNERHKRLGDSRYVVEPNVKEGKGGLRDLQSPQRGRTGRCRIADPNRIPRVPPRRRLLLGGALPLAHDHQSRGRPADL